MHVHPSVSLLIPAAAALLWLSACSSQTPYTGGQQSQLLACRQLPDVTERSRCEQRANLSYERYQAEREASRLGAEAPK